MKSWPFGDPPNVAVFVNRKIIEGGGWIAHVSHDAEDGAWQFHTSEPGPPSESDTVLVALSEIVQLDESIAVLADLPAGWHAWRASDVAPWQRSPIVLPH
jgi:hypothetical protein